MLLYRPYIDRRKVLVMESRQKLYSIIHNYYYYTIISSMVMSK